ncbi:MAG: hypothetical protein SFU25_00995 [Candidatus Caenarcaniphilales bacterium]|nr:hypothetical protein [Candidatus Caenarcaniphilales bacterium]
MLYQIIYFANILIAGIVGIFCLFSPSKAKEAVFQNVFVESEAFRITGAFWTAIAILSALGLIWPQQFVFIFLIQLIYKALWLLFGALPKLFNKKTQEIPQGMAFFFLVYVLFLPFVIPFSRFFQ